MGAIRPTEGKPMETRDIRLQNLLDLAAGYKRNAEFCEKIEMNPTYFSQIKTGRKAIGDDRARRIEEALGLQRGYLDTPKTEDKAETGQIPVETLGVAYALEALSPSVRDGLVRLIYNMAAEASDNRSDSKERSVAPFSVVVRGGHAEQDLPFQAEAAAGR